MDHSSKSLISILIISLFTLTVLQGVSILKRQSNVLGDSTSVPATNYLQRCTAIGGTCLSNCRVGDKPMPYTDCGKVQCCVPMISPTPSVAPVAVATIAPCATGKKMCADSTILTCVNKAWVKTETCDYKCLAGHCTLPATPSTSSATK